MSLINYIKTFFLNVQGYGLNYNGIIDSYEQDCTEYMGWMLETNRTVEELRKENETLYSRIDSLINVIDEMGEVLDETLSERDYAVEQLIDIADTVDSSLVALGEYSEVEYILD